MIPVMPEKLCGPQPGQRAIVRQIDPPVYKLPEGLFSGDLVILIEFSPGNWQVRREVDGTIHHISMTLIDRVLE
jgi:hypothetical protein